MTDQVADQAHEARDGATERFGSGSRNRLTVFYLLSVIPVVILIRLILALGSKLTGPAVATGSGGSTGHSAEDVLWRLLLASVVIIVAARLFGAAARRVRQPEVVGEIIAGITLGPSALGAVWPQATAFLFPEAVMPYLDVLANVGLIFFMFLVGLELDVHLLRGRGHAAVWVSHASIVAPFLSGVALALVLFPALGSQRGSFTSFALFLGASMSITAFPVLARILTECGLYRTKLGAVTLTCAAVDDVTAWCILAVVVTVVRATGASGAAVTIGLSVAFITAMLLVVRPLLNRLAAYHEQRGRLTTVTLAAIFAGIIISALITDRIGIHVIFGAFLAGAVMPHRPAFVEEITEKIHDFSVLFLLPIFFAFSGIRTEIGRIESPEMWLLTGLVLLVAVIGKWGGSTFAARLVGLEWRESSALGVLMNCRGLTELIILNIGLELGVLPPTLFAMLVLMAVATTVMTEPLLALHYPRDVQRQMVADSAGDEEMAVTEPLRRKILVPVANPRTERDLVELATALAQTQQPPAQLILLRVVELPTSTYRVGIAGQESMVAQAANGLRPLVAKVEATGLQAVPLVLASTSVDEAVTRVAVGREVDLVLIGRHQGIFGERLLGGTVGQILRNTKTDVAVLAIPSGRRLRLAEGTKIAVPYAMGIHEQAALDAAIRLASRTSGEIQLLGPSGSGDLVHSLAAETYEHSGVWTTPIPLDGDIAKALEEHTAGADLVIMGLSDTWFRKRGPSEIRHAIMERLETPLLIVRRHMRGSERVGLLVRRTRGRAGKPTEWMASEAVGR